MVANNPLRLKIIVAIIIVVNTSIMKNVVKSLSLFALDWITPGAKPNPTNIEKIPIMVKEIELIPKSSGKSILAKKILVIKMIPVENHAKIRKKMDPLTAFDDISSEFKILNPSVLSILLLKKP